MILVFSYWERFCKALAERGFKSITADNVLNFNRGGQYLVLKHDVETCVPKAFRIAQIEYKYGHCASYYVQAYLLEDAKNVELLKQMQQMGHEISYHYDVMDATGGNIPEAKKIFDRNVALFEENGFSITSICQHGNPIVNRVGYTSNRDFFRDKAIAETYPRMADIMVNFKDKAATDYLYFSDAGRKVKLIYDPVNNDRIASEDKDVPYEGFMELLDTIARNNCIISVHPHRWKNSAVLYVLNDMAFRVIRFTAKTLVKIPFFKNLFSKYFYLAKKI